MKKFVRILVIIMAVTACDTRAETPDEKSGKKSTEKPLEQQPAEKIIVEKIVDKPSHEEAKNKKMVLRFYEEVVNAHDVEAISRFAASNYLEHQYDTHYDSDLKGVKKAFKEYFTAFPDMKVKVNFMMAEGDLVTAHITTWGTNTGPIYGQKATNKKFEINGVDITRFKNGKVEEHWGFAEEGKLLTQLGLIAPLMKEGRKEQREAAKRKEYKMFPGTAEGKVN